MTALHWVGLTASAYLIWIGTIMDVRGGSLLAVTFFKFVPVGLGIGLAFCAVIPWLN